MSDNPEPHPVSTPSQQISKEPNTLGKASLVMGILGSIAVFFVALCAGVAQQQGWLPVVGTLLFIFGGTAMFVGLISTLLGFLGLFGRNRSRATAVAGLVLGIITVLIFTVVVQNAR